MIGLDTGFTCAKIAGIVVIGSYAYVANRRAGLSQLRSVVAACFLLALAAGLVHAQALLPLTAAAPRRHGYSATSARA